MYWGSRRGIEKWLWGWGWCVYVFNLLWHIQQLNKCSIFADIFRNRGQKQRQNNEILSQAINSQFHHLQHWTHDKGGDNRMDSEHHFAVIWRHPFICLVLVQTPLDWDCMTPINIPPTHPYPSLPSIQHTLIWHEAKEEISFFCAWAMWNNQFENWGIRIQQMDNNGKTHHTLSNMTSNFPACHFTVTFRAFLIPPPSLTAIIYMCRSFFSFLLSQRAQNDINVTNRMIRRK